MKNQDKAQSSPAKQNRVENDEPGVVQTTQVAGMPWKYALSGMGAVGLLGAISMFRAKRNKQALDIVKGDDIRGDL